MAMSEDKKKCFVIMPISDAEGYDKGHFTRVYEHLVKPAVIEAGFEPMRADDTSKANFIVVDILKQILESDMAICDLIICIYNRLLLNILQIISCLLYTSDAADE